MIAVRIAPDMRMAVVGSPYLQRPVRRKRPILPNIAASICACRHEGTLRGNLPAMAGRFRCGWRDS